MKFKSKPWKAPGLQIVTKYTKVKYHDKNIELHDKYKNRGNLLSTLLKESKDKYFDIYFEDNWNNLKNT